MCDLIRGNDDKPYYYFDCYFTTDETYISGKDTVHQHYLKDFGENAYIGWNETNNTIFVHEDAQKYYNASSSELFFARAVIKDNLAMKSDMPKDYVTTVGNNVMNGTLTINSDNNTNNYNYVQILAPNTTDEKGIGILIGKQNAVNKSTTLYYQEPGMGHLGMHGTPFVITWTSTSIKLNQNTTVTGNLTVSGKVTSNGSNTVTHYTPIEAGENIDDFMIGRPVFISGHVYKLVDGKWVSSTANDTTDCICSVVHKSTWKEFIGVITSIDVDNKCITFASHGDYLFYVDDSNIYAIGDVLLYDGRILDEDYAMTLKIQHSIIGIVTAKINEHMIALFKA